jgi:hypothetical protein
VWSAPASVPALLPHVVRGAEEAGFTGLMVILARTADARLQHRELTRDWTSIHDVTGQLIAVLCPDPIRWKAAIGNQMTDSFLSEIAHMHDLDLFSLGGRESSFSWGIVNSVNTHSPPGTLISVGEYAAAPYEPKEHHAAWTQAVSSCATYFGVPEAQLPAVLILSFEEKTAVLMRMWPDSDVSIYRICKHIAEKAGYSDELYERRSTLKRAERNQEWERESVERISRVLATFRSTLTQPVTQHPSDTLRSQFDGLDKHLGIAAAADPRQTQQWRDAVASVRANGTGEDAYRLLFAMRRTLLSDSGQRNWMGLRNKVNKVIRVIDGLIEGPDDYYLDSNLDWNFGAEDPIAEQLQVLEHAAAAAEGRLRDTERLRRTLEEEIAGIEARQDLRSGLAGAAEAAAYQALEAAETETGQGVGGLDGYQLRIVQPTGEPPKPPGRWRNLVSGTVHGPVVQARQISGGVHYHERPPARGIWSRVRDWLGRH